jgi:hypothetical protein
MRIPLSLAVAAVGLSAACAAQAAPNVEIKHAAVRVVVIPEARSDIQVNVVRANPRLPLRVYRHGERVIVDGDLNRRIRSCHSAFNRQRVFVLGVGDVGYDELPQVVIHTPMDVHVSANEAVFGAIGRAETVDLSNAGCGDWEVGNVTGRLRISIAGSGDVRVGTAGQADLRIAGSGDIRTQAVRTGVSATTAGSGDIYVARAGGSLNARIAGSGGVEVAGGQVDDMTVSIAGSGDVFFGGVAQTLKASVVGSGDVSAHAVTGDVVKRIAGSGDVRVGR